MHSTLMPRRCDTFLWFSDWSKMKLMMRSTPSGMSESSVCVLRDFLYSSMHVSSELWLSESEIPIIART